VARKCLLNQTQRTNSSVSDFCFCMGIQDFQFIIFFCISNLNAPFQNIVL